MNRSSNAGQRFSHPRNLEEVREEGADTGVVMSNYDRGAGPVRQKILELVAARE